MAIRMAGGGGSGSVVTNGTLTGNGTSGSPLGVKNWPLSAFINGAVVANVALGGANQTWYESFLNQGQFTFDHISVDIGNADGANNQDVGIYNSAGSLVADIGPTLWPSTGVQRFATVQGSVTIGPGIYLFAFTSQGTTATLSYTNNIWSYYSNRALVGASGGQLQSSITAPTPNLDMISWWFILD